jgi:hypothetical protein
MALCLVAVLGVAWMVSRPRAGPTRLDQRGAGSLQAPTSATGLRLLIAAAPAPFVLDVDRGTVQPISGLPADRDRQVGVMPVAEGALVLSSRPCQRCLAEHGVYLLRRRSTSAVPLGKALQVVPSRDGTGTWMLGRVGPSRCTIREVGLDGRSRRAARPVSCRTELVAELPAGLLTTSTGAGNWQAALLRPHGGVVRLGDPQARPVVGNLVLSGTDQQTPLILHDLSTGASSRLRWPSRPDYGLGEVTGDPSGRLAIVEFAKYSPEHSLDMWLLDVRARRWQRLPGMPARMVQKATGVRWTADGGVVLLSSTLLGVWRPGAPRLAVRRVRSPKGQGGDFVLW